MAIYSVFSHKKWSFSIVMLVYRRVSINPFFQVWYVFLPRKCDDEMGDIWDIGLWGWGPLVTLVKGQRNAWKSNCETWQYPKQIPSTQDVRPYAPIIFHWTSCLCKSQYSYVFLISHTWTIRLNLHISPRLRIFGPWVLANVESVGSSKSTEATKTEVAWVGLNLDRIYC